MEPAQIPLVVSITLTVVGTIAILARLYTRYFWVKNHGLDDVLAFLAGICSIGFTTCVVVQIRNSVGNPNAQFTYPKTIWLMKWTYAAGLFYAMATMLTKEAILVQFLRFLTMRPYRQICWAVIVFTALTGLTGFFWVVFLCDPIQKFWNRGLPGTCMPVTWVLLYFQTPSTILMDCIIFLLPIPVLSALRMPQARKYALMGVFLFGGFSLVAALVRIRYSLDFRAQELAGGRDLFNTLALPNISMLTSIELNVGIIAASLPTLRPVLARFTPSMLWSSWQRSTNRDAPLARASESKCQHSQATCITSVCGMSRADIEKNDKILIWPIKDDHEESLAEGSATGS